jgi:hypothetical protein
MSCDIREGRKMLLRIDSESGIPEAITLEVKELLKEAAGDFYEHPRCNKIRQVTAIEVHDDGSLGEAQIVMMDWHSVLVDCSAVVHFKYTLGRHLRWDLSNAHRVSRAAW